MSAMIRAGFSYTDDASSADVVIVNSCAFIEAAVEESIDVILDLRAQNEEAFLVVAGCLPLRYGESVKDPMPEVDFFVLPHSIDAIPTVLVSALGTLDTGTTQKERQTRHRFDLPGLPQHGAADDAASRLRTLSTPGYAYLRIAEGCSHRCHYCTIPAIRGPLRSVDIAELETEAQLLASQGARELVLVAQDLTSYGLDRREKSGLVHLLQRLIPISGVRWIRLMYLHPDGIPDDLAGIINESQKVLPYLDIPFQHVSPNVLRSMGRPWTAGRIQRLVDRLREEIDRLVLRTTFMVGYPTEAEADFRRLVDFVQANAIEHVGVFTYSPEEETKAWELGDLVPPEVKAARAAEIRSIHAVQTDSRNRKRIGAMEECLVEGLAEESELLLQGRVWDQAPEVDGVLYITAGLATGREIHSVRITHSHGPDLFGELTA